MKGIKIINPNLPIHEHTQRSPEMICMATEFDKHPDYALQWQRSYSLAGH